MNGDLERVWKEGTVTNFRDLQNTTKVWVPDQDFRPANCQLFHPWVKNFITAVTGPQPLLVPSPLAISPQPLLVLSPVAICPQPLPLLSPALLYVYSHSLSLSPAITCPQPLLLHWPAATHPQPLPVFSPVFPAPLLWGAAPSILSGPPSPWFVWSSVLPQASEFHCHDSPRIVVSWGCYQVEGLLPHDVPAHTRTWAHIIWWKHALQVYEEIYDLRFVQCDCTGYCLLGCDNV